MPVLAGALLLLALGAGAWSLWRAEGDRAAVAGGHALILALENALSALKDVETGQRGFVITARESYLEPYHQGLAELDTHMADVAARRAALGLPPDAALPPLLAARTALAAEAVALRRANNEARILEMADEGAGKRLMDEARAEVDRQQVEAERAIAAANAAGTRRAWWLGGVSAAAGLLAALLLALYARARRAAERRANALLDSVMANAPIGLGFLDRSLRVSGGNRALTETARETLGTPLGRGEALPERLRAPVEARLRAVLAGRERAEAEVEVPGAGTPHHLRVVLFPRAEGGGEGAGLVLEDITRRKRAEARLRRSEARFRDLADSIPQLAWATDAAGGITWSNQRWRDFAGGPAEGWSWTALLPEDDRAEAESRLRAAFAAGAPWEESLQMRGADGRWRWFLSRAVPLEEEEGGPVTGWFATHTDVTELREAEEAAQAAREAAEEANRAKSTFIANMSHELRTPLSAVIGYSEMLEEEAEDLQGGEALADDLRKIGSNARHLLSLINDVLDLSKIEAGRMEVQTEEFDVAALVREAAATVQALLRKKGNALALDVPDALPPMTSDPVKLRQCLINLLSNASKFTENGQVTLSVAREGDDLLFRVTDTGIGMTKEQLGRLFQRFSQADSSTTRRFGGTGLGLAITKAFADMLGGAIGVESEAGVGTTFTLRLPLHWHAPGEDAAPETGAGPAGAPVLVVDDDPASRELLSRFVRREGLPVRCARDGEEGLRLAREIRPAAILLDVMMPRMDGWSVLSAVKADPDLADTPVVMVSIVQQQALAVSLGAADYLTKPVQWPRLKRLLEKWRAPGAALIVEADDAARAELRAVLEAEGWQAEEAADCAAAHARLAQEGAPPVALVLVAVPGRDEDGLALVHALRRDARFRDLAVIALTGGALPAGELEALRGQVRRVLPADEEPPEELVAELRRLRPNPGGAPALDPGKEAAE